VIGTNISFAARLTANYASTSGSYVPTAFTEYHDDGNNFNPTTGEFTIPSNGLYQFMAHGGWGPTATGNTVHFMSRINVALFGGGNTVTQGDVIIPGLSGYGTSADAVLIRKFNAGDIVTIQFSHNSASSITLNGGTGSTTTTFSGIKLY
jgi:hypothetical protein